MLHLLTWDAAELVSLDLADGTRVVLLFDDRDDALAVGRAVAREAAGSGRRVEVVPLEATPAELAATLRPFIEARADLAGVELVGPDDPRHRELVKRALGRRVARR